MSDDHRVATFGDVAHLPVMVDLLTAARVLGIGRTTAYALARAGDFPCPVVRVGGAYRVPTAGLLGVLGLAAVGGQLGGKCGPVGGSDGDRLVLGLPRDRSAARA
jgi:hypothetical protein